MSVKNTHILLDKLNGKKHFILGNHDRQLRDESIINREDVMFVRHYFELNIKQYGYKGMSPLVLFHFPIENWNRKHYSSYHLHGHEHCSGIKSFNRLDVGVDGNHLTPWSLTEVMDYFDSDINKN